MWHPNEMDIQKTRHQDMLREAEHHRQAQAALTRQEHHHHTPFAQALAKLGEVLVSIGSELQVRYGDQADQGLRP
jgi:hypothetical protein